MLSMHTLSIRILFLGLLCTNGMSHATAVEQNDQGTVSYSRQVTFELTFANRDMIWLGDPASPTTSVYPKPGARPIATDMCVTTLVEDNSSPRRRYFREARIAGDSGQQNVYAFTSKREKIIGTIVDQGRFSPNDFYHNNRELLPSWPADVSVLAYDARENSLYIDARIPGPLVSESLDFLPLEISNASGNRIVGRFSINYIPSDSNSGPVKFAAVSLTLQKPRPGDHTCGSNRAKRISRHGRSPWIVR